MPVIRFHFDFISPYAYLAWTRIHEVAARCGAAVELAPVLFAGLLNHHGQKGPAEIPAKRLYMFKDTLRRARLAGVPLRPPPTHPFNPLLALRSVLAAPPEARRALVDALFAATWGDAPERGVERPEAVAAAARSAGLDPRELLERASTQEIKDRLRASTEEAIAAGVFGVPTMLVRRAEDGALLADGELFWGLDSLDLLELHLRGADPITPAMVAAFDEIPPSARR